MTDPVAERDAGAMAAARESLGGVTVKGTIHEGDNLAILLASYFEDWADEDEGTDENGTWKQSAVFQTEQVLNAIHAHYVTVLLSERQRGREEMRERAAEVADEYKAKMAAAQERLGALGRPTFIAECKEDAAESLATAIRALPLSETEK